MGKLFHRWSLRVSSDDGRRAPLLRTLRIQTAVALSLSILVLAATLALVETDRRIARSVQELAQERNFDEQLRERRKLIAERYPSPTLVVLVSLSGLRADRIGAYGYPAGTTPILDALADDAVVFETACAQASHTLVSGKSLLTGEYPSSLMLATTGADLVTLSSLEAPREYLVHTFAGVNPTLPASMRAFGYRTAGFTDGGWTRRKNGFQRGFERFEEDGAGLAENLDRVREHLFETRGERSFVFVHATLFEYVASASDSWPPDDLEALSARYDQAVASADAELAELIALLRELDVYDRTLLVITSEHGMSLGERGFVGSGGLALEQLLVPLIVKFPGDWHVAPRTITEPVELVDVMPTLLASSGGRSPRGVDGQSFLSIVLRKVRGREYLFAQTTLDESLTLSASGAKRMLLAPGEWQVVHNPVHDAVEFYELHGDPRALDPIRDLEGIEVPPVLHRLLGR